VLNNFAVATQQATNTQEEVQPLTESNEPERQTPYNPYEDTNDEDNYLIPQPTK